MDGPEPSSPFSFVVSSSSRDSEEEHTHAVGPRLEGSVCVWFSEYGSDEEGWGDILVPTPGDFTVPTVGTSSSPPLGTSLSLAGDCVVPTSSEDLHQSGFQFLTISKAG